MKSLKKIFTCAIVVLTIVWAIGLSAFVPTAQAATLVSGDLIKQASSTAVYYYASSGSRYIFPNDTTYFTWYSDWTNIKVVTSAELSAIPIASAPYSNVTFRPGVKLAKFNTDPKVYAVAPGGVLRWITTEAVALALYGGTWSTKVSDIPESFYGNYTIGAPINVAADYTPATAMSASPTINADKGLGSIGTGNLNAALSSDTPAGATIALNATGARVLKFTVGGSGTLTNLTFKDEGIGSAADIAAVYLYDGATRLTAGKTINSTTKEVSFSLNVAISATKTYFVVIDMGNTPTATPYGQHRFSLISLNGGAMTGVTGNTFTVGAQAVSNVTINPTTVPVNPKVGQQAAEIANFKITGGTNASAIQALTLTQAGSINAEDLTNFVLKQGTTTVATAAGVTGDKIVLTFPAPFALASGVVRNFTLYADVAGRPGRTISVYLDENSDLNVTDSVYGFGCTVTSTFTAGTMAIADEGGVLTIAFNGPVTGNVSKGGQDVPLFKFALTAAAPITVKNSWMKIAGVAAGMVKGSGGTNYFTDIKLVNTDTGAVVSGPISIPGAVLPTATTTGTMQMSDDFDFSGTLNLTLTADLQNVEDAPAEFFTNAYQVTLGTGATLFGAADVKYQASNDFVAATDIVPNTLIMGNAQTVLASSLSIDLSSYIGNNVNVKGAKDAQSVALALTAGSDSDVTVTKLVLSPKVDTGLTPLFTKDATYGNDANASAVVAGVKLWKKDASGLTLLDGPRGVAGLLGAEKVTFQNFSLTVAKGSSVLLVVTFDATTTSGVTLLPTVGDDLVFTVNAGADVTAQDKDNNTVVPTTTYNAGTFPVNLTAGVPTIMSTVLPVGLISLTSDISDSNYKTRLLQENATNEKVLRVKAKAADEPFKITQATLTVTNVTVGDGRPNPITLTITYPTDAAQTIMESKTVALVGNAAIVSGMNWYVPANVDSYASVTSAINVDTNGAVSGINAFEVQIEAASADLGGLLTKALGLSSGTYAGQNGTGAFPGSVNADAVGNAQYARKTLLTIDKAAGSPSGTMVAGAAEFLKVTITNSTGSSATLSTLTFKTNASDSASNWGTGLLVQLKDAADPGTFLAAVDTVGPACGGFPTTCVEEHSIALGVPITISAGSSKTLQVWTDTTGASAVNHDTFRIDMVTDTVPGGGSCTAGDCLVWDDGQAPNNGYKVTNLPITGGNVQF